MRQIPLMPLLNRGTSWNTRSLGTGTRADSQESH